MKKLLTLAALVGATTVSFAQGVINWQNSSATLISAGSVGTAATAGLYNYAVFFAPSATASADFTAASGVLGLTDPAFQTASVYNVNAAALGRVATKNGAAVATSSPGSVVDFVIRGWSVNAGATWAEALAFWNNGTPSASMTIGTSLIGNDYTMGGGAIPVAGLMGVTGSSVGGFNMTIIPVPEPSSMVLAGLGAASLLLFRRRK